MSERRPRALNVAALSKIKSEISALQALFRGEAQAHQQNLALQFIVADLAQAYDRTFDPASDRLSAFAEGRRFVGLEILRLLDVNIAALKE